MINGGYPVWADYSNENLAFGNRPLEKANKIVSERNIVNIDKDFSFAKVTDQTILYASNDIRTVLTPVRNENE